MVPSGRGRGASGAHLGSLARSGLEALGARELRSARRTAGVLWTTAGLLVGERGDLDARAFALRAHRTARTLLAIMGVDVRCTGSLPEAPAVVVTNHVSYLDPLVIAALTPCIAVAKGEVEGWPLIGRGLRALGVVFVRRGDPHSGAVALRRARRVLDGGTVVLNFPEGTTTDGRTVGPFRRGIFGLAGIAGVGVVPAHIAYDDDRVPWFGGQTLAPHYWRLSRAAAVQARVHFADPIRVGPSDRPHDVATRARAIIAAFPATPGS